MNQVNLKEAGFKRLTIEDLGHGCDVVFVLSRASPFAPSCDKVLEAYEVILRASCTKTS